MCQAGIKGAPLVESAASKPTEPANLQHCWRARAGPPCWSQELQRHPLRRRSLQFFQSKRHWPRRLRPHLSYCFPVDKAYLGDTTVHKRQRPKMIWSARSDAQTSITGFRSSRVLGAQQRVRKQCPETMEYPQQVV